MYNYQRNLAPHTGDGIFESGGSTALSSSQIPSPSPEVKIKEVLEGRSIRPSYLNAAQDQDFEELIRSYPIRGQLADLIVSGEVEHKELKPFLEQVDICDRLGQAIVSGRDNRFKALRPVQQEILEDILLGFEDGENRGDVKGSTGIGKTVTFGALAVACDVPTIIIVPKSNLAEQTRKEIEAFFPESKENVCEIHGSLKESPKKIIITTYQYLLAEQKKLPSEREIDLNKVRLVVGDEIHKGLGIETQKMLRQFPEEAAIVAFSATPKDSEILPRRYHEISLPEAVRLGAVCPLVTFPVKVKIDISDVPIQDGTYKPEELGKKLLAAGAAKAAFQLYTKGFPEQSLIGFTSGVAEAHGYANYFSERGITAAAIDGTTPKDEQKRIIDAYKKGEIKALFSADLLIEGFDAKIASVCINFAPTNSPFSAEQRGGRVGRLYNEWQEKIGTIIDLVYEDSRRREPQLLFYEILGGITCPSLSELEDDPRNQAVKDLIERIKSLEIKDVKVIIEESEALSVKNELDALAGKTPPPEGWISLHAAAVKLKVETSRLRRAASALKEELNKHEYVGKFYDAETKSFVRYFSPESIPLLEQWLGRGLTSQGWKPVRTLGKLWGTGNSSETNRIIGELRPEFPNDIKVAWSVRKELEVVSPAFVAAGKERAQKVLGEGIGLEKKGWLTKEAIRERFGLSLEEFNEIIISIPGASRSAKEVYLQGKGNRALYSAETVKEFGDRVLPYRQNKQVSADLLWKLSKGVLAISQIIRRDQQAYISITSLNPNSYGGERHVSALNEAVNHCGIQDITAAAVSTLFSHFQALPIASVNNPKYAYQDGQFFLSLGKLDPQSPYEKWLAQKYIPDSTDQERFVPLSELARDLGDYTNWLRCENNTSLRYRDRTVHVNLNLAAQEFGIMDKSFIRALGESAQQPGFRFQAIKDGEQIFLREADIGHIKSELVTFSRNRSIDLRPSQPQAVSAIAKTFILPEQEICEVIKPWARIKYQQELILNGATLVGPATFGTLVNELLPKRYYQPANWYQVGSVVLPEAVRGWTQDFLSTDGRSRVRMLHPYAGDFLRYLGFIRS